jgi:hypothetical protein
MINNNENEPNEEIAEHNRFIFSAGRAKELKKLQTRYLNDQIEIEELKKTFNPTDKQLLSINQRIAILRLRIEQVNR